MHCLRVKMDLKLIDLNAYYRAWIKVKMYQYSCQLLETPFCIMGTCINLTVTSVKGVPSI